MAWDLRLLAIVQAQSCVALTWTMLVLSAIGSGWALLVLIPLLVRASTRRIAGHLLGAVLVTAALVFLAKHVVRRARPCASVAWVQTFVVAPRDPSFPSGHAAGSATVASFAWVTLRRRRTAQSPLRDATCAVGLALVAGGVALSRVYLGVHFPSDVLAGALLGSMVGGVVALRLEPAGAASGTALPAGDCR
jgi:undecaprenyl-diphosphatase